MVNSGRVHAWPVMARESGLGSWTLPQAVGGNMPRLVLIQQSPILQELEHSFVRRNGFKLVTGASGRELLERARQEGADLVIASVIMPDLSGLELCSLLRASSGTEAIPVLLFGPEAERGRASAAGASAFLPLPLTPRGLVGAVRRFFPVEERGASRAPIAVKVVCRDGDDTYVAFTGDISASGLFLKGALPVAPGARLRLRMRVPGDTAAEDLELSAEVVRRARPGSEGEHLQGVGVRFLDFPLIRKVPITRFVREHSAG